MTYNIAIQMDHPEDLNYSKDSTYVLALEGQKRGHNLFFYHPSTLGLNSGTLNARVAPITFSEDQTNPYALADFKETDLSTFDMILMRQDFNDPLSYSAVTYLLDHITNQTLILNDPAGTRESPEKILITHYPDLTAPTLISRNLDDIRAFQHEHKEIIIKPMNGFGGLDIYHMKDGDDNIQAVFDMLTRLHSEPLIIQKYLPEIRQGDKRLIVVEGEPIAALLRVPAENNARANLAVGGSAASGEITERDREICSALKDELVKRGLVFVGIDVIGDYVTEINPKSPTGLQHIKQLQDLDCCPAIWDAYEKRMEDFNG